MAGGLGARAGQDGVDTGGMQNIVQARIPDVEMNEFAYPILYLWRREEPDSGGPGRFRGGVGGSSCFILHDTPARQMNLTVSSTGKAFPQATGMSGGYPANTAYDVMFRNSTMRDQLRRTGLPRKLADIDGQPEFIQVAVDSYMSWDDVYYTHWQGGGGYGDPLMREPASVAKDIAEGKVTPLAAREVYGVIPIEGCRADEEATRHCRQELRSSRRASGKAEPFRVNASSVPDGRILDDNLLVDMTGNTCCRHCGTVVGTDKGLFLSKAHRREGSPALAGPQIHGDPAHFVDEKIVFRHTCCPGCFASLLTEIVPISDRGHRLKTLARQGTPLRAAKG